jgi:hypothetical protein
MRKLKVLHQRSSADRRFDINPEAAILDYRRCDAQTKLFGFGGGSDSRDLAVGCDDHAWSNYGQLPYWRRA